MQKIIFSKRRTKKDFKRKRTKISRRIKSQRKIIRRKI